MSPFPRSKSGYLFAVLLAGSLAGPMAGWASSGADDAMAPAAEAAAQHWLAEIDACQYDESYAEGCTAFHNKVSHQQWVTVLEALHPAIGSMVNRKEIQHAYKPDGFEGLDGECMVITYNTVFTKLGPTLEVVVLKREDGTWRGAGYNAQPQTPPQDNSQ